MESFQSLPTIFKILSMTTSLVFALPVDYNEISTDTAAFDLSYLGESVFVRPNTETGLRVESWNESSPENPEELGQYAEGDIVFPSRSRNGLITETFRWPNGVVPYDIPGSYSSAELDLINRAMEIYKKYTCITFRRRNAKDRDYISIVNGRTGCWSSVGHIQGRQEVNLQNPSCTTKIGTILHEFMHAIGFLHEQSRYDRDEYITVVKSNIKSGQEGNFKKADKGTTYAFGVKYDYRSVMHYSSKAFSANGQPTLVPKDDRFLNKIGQREGFSRGDITKINAMYNCPEKTQQILNNTGPFPNNTETNTDTNQKGQNNLLSFATDLFSLFIH